MHSFRVEVIHMIPQVLGRVGSVRVKGNNATVLVAALLLCGTLSGCASLTNPVANGIPVHLLPPELLGEPKGNLESIPLTSLRQPPPDAYRLAPEDVLGIWIEPGILGEK